MGSFDQGWHMYPTVDALTRLEAASTVERYLELCGRPMRLPEQIERKLHREYGPLHLLRPRDRDYPLLEAEFIAVAAAYGAQRGICYETWREAGVPAVVLRKAGIWP